MTAVQTVDISPTNLGDFAALYLGVFNAPPWNDGWSPQAVQERLASFLAFPRFEGLGLLEHGEPIGLVLGWGERWVAGWQFHIKEMCIATAHQGQGAGSRLLQAFEARLRDRGYGQIYLETGQSAPSRLFYERHGYEDIGYVSLAKRNV